MTNKLIKSKWLRSLYAQELWQARIIRKSFGEDYWAGFRFGIESGIWAMQKAIA